MSVGPWEDHGCLLELIPLHVQPASSMAGSSAPARWASKENPLAWTLCAPAPHQQVDHQHMPDLRGGPGNPDPLPTRLPDLCHTPRHTLPHTRARGPQTLGPPQLEKCAPPSIHLHQRHGALPPHFRPAPRARGREQRQVMHTHRMEPPPPPLSLTRHAALAFLGSPRALLSPGA